MTIVFGMTRYSFFIYCSIFSIVFVLACSFLNEDIRPLNLRIKNGEFKVDKLMVSADWKITPLKSKLGIPQKTIKGVNTTYTYTDLGLVLFEGVDSTINEIQIYYNIQNSTKVSPYSVFRGDLKIDKLMVENNLTKELMFETLLNWNPGPSYTAHLYRAQKEGIYLYFEFEADEKSLVKVIIGRVN